MFVFQLNLIPNDSFAIIRFVFRANANFPASKEIASTHVEFSNVANVRGFVNCTTPFPDVTWLRTDLNYTTLG